MKIKEEDQKKIENEKFTNFFLKKSFFIVGLNVCWSFDETSQETTNFTRLLLYCI
jgi:hypothetical protein